MWVPLFLNSSTHESRYLHNTQETCRCQGRNVFLLCSFSLCWRSLAERVRDWSSFLASQGLIQPSLVFRTRSVWAASAAGLSWLLADGYGTLLPSVWNALASPSLFDTILSWLRGVLYGSVLGAYGSLMLQRWTLTGHLAVRFKIQISSSGGKTCWFRPYRWSVLQFIREEIIQENKAKYILALFFHFLLTSLLCCASLSFFHSPVFFTHFIFFSPWIPFCQTAVPFYISFSPTCPFPKMIFCTSLLSSSHFLVVQLSPLPSPESCSTLCGQAGSCWSFAVYWDAP